MGEIRPSWHFVLANEGADSTSSWTWRRMRADGTIEQISESQSSFGHAVSDAIDHGFRPKTVAWAVISGGRYTHFKAGEQPIGIPDDRDPIAPAHAATPETPNGDRLVGEPEKSKGAHTQ